ncbi:MAG: bifunctional UDP-N-acetylglucosamine diphosphorylase/glucosamine-1-phosphate N-acetyltransferase GlmU [Anaerolineae bacterium]|nr:bifunctional UDP-N-acetylglucosamine diphosphorylase/glucosamine-1-phosphate N-acetyltransferase GlmU [Anaerolineae bacterium]
MSTSIVILAAGKGTRIKSELPKVLHPLAGRPMVQFVVDAARALDPEQLTVVVGEGAELVREAVGSGVTYALQAERLGTGHALQQARTAAAGRADTVLVLYGDTPLIRAETLWRMAAHHAETGAAATILTFRPQNPAGYGRIVRDGETGQVAAIVEDKAATPKEKEIGEVNSGLLCFRDEWVWERLERLERQPGGEYYLTDLVAMARAEGERVAALEVDDALEVMGVDHRAKLAVAAAEMRRRINERWMLAGVTMIDPETTYVDAGVEIGVDTTIGPNTILQGATRIGRGCTVGPNSVVRSSTIEDRCRVEMSVVEQAWMEEGSDVGPFGHLRKGARLGRGAHMGNFGEVKNSYLGPGAKMGHFSYLGDATVGAGANIGAGTITCNYDGQQKHPTTIGEGAFIGSDTMLVAPVEVGEGARTGAGSVVTHNVPPGRVAYGVPARVKPLLENRAGEPPTEVGQEET